MMDCHKGVELAKFVLGQSFAKFSHNRTRLLSPWKWAGRIALGLFLLFGFAQQGFAQTNPLTFSKNYFVTGDYVVGGWDFTHTGNISIPDTVQAAATGVPSPSVPPGADIVAAFLYWQTVESTNAGSPTGMNGFFNGYPIAGTNLGSSNAPTNWSSGGCGGSSMGSKTIRTYRADVRPFLPVDASGKVQGNGTFPVSLVGAGSNQTPFTEGASLVIIYRVQSPSVPLNSIVLYDGDFAPSNQTAGTAEMSQTMQGFYQPDAIHKAKLTHIVGDGQSGKTETAQLNGVNLPFLYSAVPGVKPGVAFPGIYNGSWDNTTWDVTSLVKGGAIGFDTSETTSVVQGSSGGGCVDWGAIVFSTTVQDSDGDGLLDAWEDNQGYTDAISGQFVALPGANKSAKDIFVEVDYVSNLDGSAGAYLHSHLPKQLALDMVGDAFAKQNTNIHFDVGTKYNGNGFCKQTPAAFTGQQLCPDPYIIQYPVAGGNVGGNSISESTVVCTDSAKLCQFPGTPSVGWKEGLLFVKKNATVPGSNPAVTLGGFQFGRKDSYHYVLFGHALGMPRSFWTAFGATLPGNSFAKLVSIVNSAGTATITIQSPPGVVKPGDCPNASIPACSDANVDRVTVGGSIGQPALNSAYHFSIQSQTPVPNTSLTQTVLTIATTSCTVSITTNCVDDGTYSFSNEPRLEVEYLGPTSTSGHSDIGGGDTEITFGLWPEDDDPGCQADPSVALTAGQMYCINQVGTITAEAGTLLHEMGHTFFLTHGGTFYPNGAVTSGPLAGQQGNNPLGVPSYGLNCNPGFLSSMNYLHQIRGFPDGGIDYSGQTLPNLSELLLNETPGIGLDVFTGGLAAHFTRWYAPPNALDIQIQNTTGGRFATVHCDGTPITDGAQMVRVDGSTLSAPIDWDNDLDPVPDPSPLNPVPWQDVNFNGSTLNAPDAPFPGFNDWVNVDLRQVSSRLNALGFSSGGALVESGGGGVVLDSGGGGVVLDSGGGGASLESGGGGAMVESGGGGVVLDSGGGGAVVESGGGGTEQDQETACSTADPPTGLGATLGSKSVVLNWSPPGHPCQIRRYDVWRATGLFLTLQDVLANTNQFKNLTPSGITCKSQGGGNNCDSAPSPTFTDTTVKNNTTYTYFVTDTNKQKATSRPSKPTNIFVK